MTNACARRPGLRAHAHSLLIINSDAMSYSVCCVQSHVQLSPRQGRLHGSHPFHRGRDGRCTGWGWQMYVSRVCGCAQRTGAAARESLRRNCHGKLTLPAFHTCGSASPFRARCCHSSKKEYIHHPYPVHPPSLIRGASTRNQSDN